MLSWILESEVEELEEKIKRIKNLAIECDADERTIQPYEVLDIINEYIKRRKQQ